MTETLIPRLDGGTVAPARAPSALGRIARARRQLLLYALIGSVALVTDLGLFATTTLVWGWSPLVAHTVSVPVAAGLSFVLNARLNFRQTDRWGVRMASFAVVAAIGYAVGAVVIWVVTDGFGGPGLAAKLMSLPLVFALQYRLNSRVTFRPQGPRR